jgi:hypothetical protein
MEDIIFAKPPPINDIMKQGASSENDGGSANKIYYLYGTWEFVVMF